MAQPGVQTGAGSMAQTGDSEQRDIRHGAEREWVDRLIDPTDTRDELIGAVRAAVQGWDFSRDFKTGVLQT